MKTYSVTVDSYSVTELSEKAQEKAHTDWLYKGSYFWEGDELRDTLDEFCRIFDVKLKHWEYDSITYSCRFDVKIDEDQESLSGIRLATFVWNNYADFIRKGRYFSLWSKVDKNPHWKNENSHCPRGKLKTRYSKVMWSLDDCPLTGVRYDMDILDPVIKCLTYKKMYGSYSDLIKACLDNFFKMAVKEYEYSGSLEAFIEMADANEYEYDENGGVFRLPAGFVAV